jgi:hypothetical protein
MTSASFAVFTVCEPGVLCVSIESGQHSGMESRGADLKLHAFSLFLGAFSCCASRLRAGGTVAIAASLVPTQVADSLPFAALIGLIALGAILVLRKMIRDLF